MNMIGRFLSLFSTHYFYELLVYLITYNTFRFKIEKSKAVLMSFLFPIFASFNFAISVILIGGGIIPETPKILVINNVLLILEQVVIIIYLKITFELPFYKTYWYTFILHTGIGVPFQLFYVNGFIYLDGNNQYVIGPTSIKQYLHYATILVIMAAAGLSIYYITRIIIRLKKVFRIPNWCWFCINLVWVVQFFFVQRNYTANNSISKIRNSISTEHVVLTSLIIIAVMYLSNNYTDKKLLKVENDLLMKQNELQYTNFLAMQQQELQIHKLYHDIGNHIKTIQILVNSGETQEAKAYTESLEKEYREIRKEYYCNNKIINAVLSQKLKICKDRNIDYHLELNIKEELPIRDIDLMCVYSNLLDNAIEACQRDAKEDKFIRLMSSVVGNYLVVKIINSKPLERKATNEKSRAFTWKKDKTLHGYGLRILEEIIERYDGQREFLDKGEEYSSMIMLMLSE